MGVGTVAAAKKLMLDWVSPEGSLVTHIRSTMLHSSIATLKDRGLYERYVERLDPAVRDEILLNLSPSWLPVEIGMAHYRACDALELNDEQLQQIGEAASQRVMGTFLGTITRRSRDVGGTPWLVVRSYDTLWSRVFRGGGVKVYEEGPKDAILIGTGNPISRLRYFDTAYLGVVKGALGLFSRAVYVRPGTRRGDDLVAVVRWV